MHHSSSEEAHPLADTVASKHRYVEGGLWCQRHVIPCETKLAPAAEQDPSRRITAGFNFDCRSRVVASSILRPEQPPGVLESEEGAPSSCTKNSAGGWLRRKRA
ncbi:hypothetical protein MRX96_003345 [Rhipicephalus microplus]